MSTRLVLNCEREGFQPNFGGTPQEPDTASAGAADWHENDVSKAGLALRGTKLVTSCE